MPKHFFFDLDNTLTPSKSLILPEHVPVFKSLSERANIIIASGHGATDIRAHLTPELAGTYSILGQNGNYAESKDGTILWSRSLFQTQKDAIHNFIQKARAKLHYDVRDENDIVDDRDSQIAFSLIGHHEDKEKKHAFDPTHEKRLALLADMPEDLQKLTDAEVEVQSGGTTVLDFFSLGKNKGYNVGEFITAMGWSASDCIFIGDALFPGGNDSTVIGIIPTHAVKNPHETFEFINKMLG